MSSNSLVQEFLYGVDWSEPWLIALLGFHFLTCVSILSLRHHTYMQAVILAILVVMCFSSERINEYAALNYEWFSKEQYFDSNGLFIFVVYAGPIIFNCFLIVVCWLYAVWNTMVQLGILKAQRRKRQASKENTSSTPQQKGHTSKENTNSSHKQKKT